MQSSDPTNASNAPSNGFGEERAETYDGFRLEHDSDEIDDNQEDDEPIDRCAHAVVRRRLLEDLVEPPPQGWTACLGCIRSFPRHPHRRPSITL